MASSESKKPTCFPVYLEYPGDGGIEVTAVKTEEEARQLVAQLEANLQDMPRKGRPRAGYAVYTGPLSSIAPALAAQL